MKLGHYILILCTLFSSCSEETLPTTGSLQRLSIEFDNEVVGTKSYWNDLTDDATNHKVAYIWENSDNMLTAIKHSGQYVPFYE